MRKAIYLMVLIFVGMSFSGMVENNIVDPPIDSFGEKIVSSTTENTQWTSGYECPVEDTDLCSTAIVAGTTHNEWLELLRSTGETTPFSAPNSGAALTNLDSAVVKADDEALLTSYLGVRSHQKTMYEDFYNNNDVTNMSLFEIQQANALSVAEFREADTENLLHDEVLDLISGLLDIVRNGDQSDESQSQFENELDSIIAGRDFSSASEDAQQTIVLIHAVYHASDWYWDDADLGRGNGFWKKVGDALAIAGGATLTIVSGGADNGIGLAVVEGALGSFQGSQSGAGITDPLICIDNDWEWCAILNIAISESESRSDHSNSEFLPWHRFSIPDDWSFITDNRETTSKNSTEEKSVYGVYHNAQGWHVYTFDEPMTCEGVDNLAPLWEMQGTDSWTCHATPGGGVWVVVVLLANPDIEIGFATPQGDISYTPEELFDLGYLLESRLIKDLVTATEIMKDFHNDRDSAELCKSDRNISSDLEPWVGGRCWVSGSLNGVPFDLMFANKQCSEMSGWMETQEGIYGSGMVWSDPACQDYSPGWMEPYCEISGYFTLSADADDADKSGEKVDSDKDSSLPGFTLLPLFAALGLAILYSRKGKFE